MGSKLADLLKWRAPVEIKDKKGETAATVYMRVIGDDDLKLAYKNGRLASSTLRLNYRNDKSLDSKSEFSNLKELTKEELITIIVNVKQNDFAGEAAANVVRPNAVELEEVAVDADAPTLEEQEKLDNANTEGDFNYLKALQEYVENRTTEERALLEAKDEKDLYAEAKSAIININSLQAFLDEVQEWKVYRSVFADKLYKEPAFDSIEEFKGAATSVRNQLFEAYKKLEIGNDAIKN